eukprot:TRINITY_DN51719_c0_g1_i1.p1 TRINITY_DN51719_c0_g1~~TRINITY_DN51719_c0_g1_i1.p1  ORF type:complete len:115 (+),score=5.71 TRINITY_DN51719_c0_g1_i1:185-529(+)
MHSVPEDKRCPHYRLGYHPLPTLSSEPQLAGRKAAATEDIVSPVCFADAESAAALRDLKFRRLQTEPAPSKARAQTPDPGRSHGPRGGTGSLGAIAVALGVVTVAWMAFHHNRR